MKNYTPYRKLIHNCGVNRGDVLMVASDITRLAILASRNEKTFDVNAFIDSICQKLGPEGTLIIPAYNHDLRSGQHFDLKNTRPQTGALALAAFERKDFVRTWHPLHSFLVWGKQAAFFESLHNKSSFGKDSPFAYMAKLKTKMLFISTSFHRSFTYTHYVEEKEQVSYRKFKDIQIYYRKDEKSKERLSLWTIYAKKRGWDLDFRPLESTLKEQGLLKEYHLNGLKFQTIKIKAAAKIIRDDIRNNNAKGIAGFSLTHYLKTLIKDYLYKLKLFVTTTDKIRNAGNIF